MTLKPIREALDAQHLSDYPFFRNLHRYRIADPDSASKGQPRRPEASRMAKSETSTDFLDRLITKRELTKRQALDKTRQLVTSNPAITPLEIADQIGKSRQAVYDYLAELEVSGQLSRNGGSRM